MDQSKNPSTFTRIDYIQVGLTSKNAMKLIQKLSPQTFEVAIGDHSGSLHYFSINTNNNQIETIFKTLPGPNAKINCIDAYSGLKQGGSKIFIVYGPSIIKGFNKKGKQFFSLELNNLTEPIKMFHMHRQPDEIHVLGQYIYNSYLVNTELVLNSSSSGSSSIIPSSKTPTSTYNSVVRSRHYYVCPTQINDFVLIEDQFNRRIVPVLACQDRLLRVLKDSSCTFEVEVCGIPSVLQIVPKRLYKSLSSFSKPNPINNSDFVDNYHVDTSMTINKDSKSFKDSNVNLCYGTMDGKISMVTFQFIGKNQLEPLHHWEIPINTIKQPITCLCFSDSQSEFYVGRSDGSIEIWRLNESIQDGDVEQQVDLTVPPTMIDSYNCSESITNILPILVGERCDLLLLCCTFTGLVFGLSQHSQAKQMKQLNPNFLMISKENADKIRSLQEECQRLEKQLETERKNYAKHMAMASAFQSSTSDTITWGSSMPYSSNDGNLSVLPFFAMNDSFVLHNDASYILMLEVEVCIDVVVLHCDLPLDLIDCERNSAVISFNDDQIKSGSGDEVLVIFRCQTNTSRLEIRLRPVEGQHGTLLVYVISRITPKSCQTRSYQIQPLSLHKRQYSNTRIEYPNTLTITGPFGLADAHTWLRLCIPEIPEKLSLTISDVESEVFYYVSTMTKSILICNCGRGVITMSSDNVSTISILKDFITREATRQSIEISIDVDLTDKSLEAMLTRLYPQIRWLIRRKHRQDLLETLADLQSSDVDIVRQLLTDLNLASSPDENENDISNINNFNFNEISHRDEVIIGLDRIYGIITDLFIDYHKLKNSSIVTSLVAMAKQKLPEMIEMIETMVLDSFDLIDTMEEISPSEKFQMKDSTIIIGDGLNDDHGWNVSDSGQQNGKIGTRLGSITSKDSSKKNTIISLIDDPNINLFIDRLFKFWNVSI